MEPIERLKLGVQEWLKDAVLDFIAHIRGRVEDMDAAYLKLKRSRNPDA